MLLAVTEKNVEEEQEETPTKPGSSKTRTYSETTTISATNQGLDLSHTSSLKETHRPAAEETECPAECKHLVYLFLVNRIWLFKKCSFL